MSRPKTIQIYLPSGDPKASKIAEISSELGKLIFCSRKNIDFLKNRPESNYVGIYFLFGKTDGEKASAYIGEAEKLFDRLKTHLADKEKEWFSSIVFFTTKDNSFNKALVKYFESYCIDKAYEADRFSLMNRKSSSRANLSEALEADIETYYDSLKLLMSTIGFSLFDKLSTGSKLYYFETKNCNAFGEYTNEGFIVKKGSTLVDSFRQSVNDSIKKNREELISDGTIIRNNDGLIFDKDHLFSSPSMAGAVVYGGNVNGWIYWKSKAGKTLDEMERNKHE
jgi:hypothetical protein